MYNQGNTHNECTEVEYKYTNVPVPVYTSQ